MKIETKKRRKKVGKTSLSFFSSSHHPNPAPAGARRVVRVEVRPSPQQDGRAVRHDEAHPSSCGGGGGRGGGRGGGGGGGGGRRPQRRRPRRSRCCALARELPRAASHSLHLLHLHLLLLLLHLLLLELPLLHRVPLLLLLLLLVIGEAPGRREVRQRRRLGWRRRYCCSRPSSSPSRRRGCGCGLLRRGPLLHEPSAGVLQPLLERALVGVDLLSLLRVCVVGKKRRGRG